jgi:hypothetical protein
LVTLRSEEKGIGQRVIEGVGRLQTQLLSDASVGQLHRQYVVVIRRDGHWAACYRRGWEAADTAAE